MCQGCWEEYGSARIDSPAVRAAARAIDAVYEYSCVGGHLHIVVDDWNLDDDSLDFCADAIEHDRHGCDGEQLEAERRCLGLLRGLDEQGRASALALQEKFWTFQPAGG